MRKTLLCVLAFTVLGVLLTACGGKTTDEIAAFSASALYGRPAQSGGIGKQELLAVSFGTSYNGRLVRLRTR